MGLKTDGTALQTVKASRPLLAKTLSLLVLTACGPQANKSDPQGDSGQDNSPTAQNPTVPTTIKNGANPSVPSSAATGTIALSFSADGVKSILEGSALNLAGIEDESYSYPGIGMNFGESIVEGLRIKLLSIWLWGTDKETGNPSAGISLVDFGAEGKELEISEGFNGKIEIKKDVSIGPGEYTQLQISVASSFSLKAYAYLDTDNNGTIDTTIWTTQTQIKMLNQKLAPGAMPDYDWFSYPWLVATTAKSVTDNSDTPSSNFTLFPEPLVVTDQGVESGGTVSKELSLTLLVDTFRVIKVWDGRFPSNNGSWTPGDGNASVIPAPVFPFPGGLNDTRRLLGDLKTYDFFPPGKPAFAFGNYLSLFGFINQPGVKAHNYVISKSSTITPYNSQSMTILLDQTGKPLFGKSSLGESSETLHIGPMARVFEKANDGSYSFATAYGMVDENGKWDGGLYYSNDVGRAGHLFSGFRKLGISQRGQMIMKNGPRCKEEHDYCILSNEVNAYYLRAQ